MRSSLTTLRPGLILIVSLVLFVFDRIFKQIALSSPEVSQNAIAGFMLFKNTGIAFSIPVAAWIFWPAALTVFAVLLWLLARSYGKDHFRTAVLCCLLLGAFSNLVDRALYGATIDYLILFSRSAVNIADAMIIAGTVLLLTQSIQKSDPRFVIVRN